MRRRQDGRARARTRRKRLDEWKMENSAAGARVRERLCSGRHAAGNVARIRGRTSVKSRLCGLVLGGALLLSVVVPAPSAELVVTVEDVRSDAGDVRLSLFASAAEWP